MMILGVAACFGYIELYYRKKGLSKKIMYAIEINACASVIVGIICAILTQNIYNFIVLGTKYTWTWAMTFYGGLIGGGIELIFCCPNSLLVFHVLNSKCISNN